MPKTYFITGANRGIGLELTRQVLRKGDHVLATCRDPDEAHALQDLARLHMGTCTLEALDVTSDESIGDLAPKLHGRIIDVLVNNAGLLHEYEEKLDTASVDLMAEMLNTNTLGCIRITKAFLPCLRRSKSPLIVHISSGVGSISNNEGGKAYGYRMSKAALNMFSRSFSIDYPQITSIVMHPGWVRTDMGGRDADLSVEESAAGVLGVLDRLRPGDTGKFMDWRGRELPW